MREKFSLLFEKVPRIPFSFKLRFKNEQNFYVIIIKKKNIKLQVVEKKKKKFFSVDRKNIIENL